MVDFRIRVIVDPTGANRGLQTTERGLNRVNAAAERTRRLIGAAFAFTGLTAGIGGLIQLADTYTNIQNRIRTVTTGTEELNLVTGRLFEIANRTRSSFEATAEVYARVALATKELGVSQQQTLEFTESLNQAVILSGANAAEAQAGLIQLSQGLASGALRGDELRSVLEQLPVVADVIADQLEVTRGGLRELGADGAISAEIVLEAFKSAREELEERFAETVPTIGQSFQVLRNNVIGLVGAFNEGSGLGRQFSQIILALADNLPTVVRAVGTLAIAIGVSLARQAIGAAISGFRALAVAIATNPIGAIATVITLAVSALIAFSDQLALTGGSAATVFDFLAVTFDRFVAVFQGGLNFVLQALGVFQRGVDQFDFLEFVNAAAKAIDALIGVFTGGFDAVVAIFSDFPRVIGDLIIQGLNFVLRQVESFTNGIIRALNRIPGVSIDTLDGVVPQLENIFEGAAANVGTAAIEGFNRGFNQGLAQDLVSDLASEAEQRAVDRIEREAEEAERLARREALLAAIGDRAAPTAAQNDALERQRDLLESIRGPADELQKDFKALEALYTSGQISLEEYNRVFNQLRLEALELETTAGAGVERFFRTVAENAQTTADFVEGSLGAVFDNLTDTLEEFANTGKFSFSDFTNSILKDINRLAAQGVSDQIAGIFGSIFTGGGGGGTIGGGGGGGFGGIISNLAGSFLGGFNTGGQIMVGGTPGIDRNLLSLNGQPIARVSRGETLGISPNGGGQPINVNFNISTPDADSFRRSQDQILSRTSQQLQRAQRRNG